MNDSREHSIFWPIVLIVVGALWLLSNFNLIPAFNLGLLFNLWPLLLIVGGINLIIGRRYPLLRAFITLAAAALAVLYMLFAPQLGLVTTPEIREAAVSEPIGDATSATIQIDSSIGRTFINPLVDSSNLIEADLSYIGELVFETTGTTEKTIRLRVESEPFDTNLSRYVDENRLRWDIGLTPNIPLSLDFSGGVGEIVMDLSGLTFSEVYVNGGVGELEVTLPAQEGLYTVKVEGGVGKFVILVEDGAELELEVNAGVGEFVIDVPEDAGVELSANTGVGKIRLPSRFDEVRPAKSGIGESGLWETEDFDTADYQIFIVFDGGVGDLRIR